MSKEKETEKRKKSNNSSKFHTHIKQLKSSLILNWQLFKVWIHTRYYNVKERAQKSKWFNNGVNAIIWPYILIMILLIVIPLFFIFLYSLIQPTNNSLVFEVSVQNFVNFFASKALVVSLMYALGYALVSSIFAVIIGYPVAYVMAFSKSKLFAKNIWILVTLPIWINMLLKIIGLQTLFNIVAPGLLGTPVAVVVGMIYAFIPFVILAIYNSLEKIDRNLIEASRDLGASAYKTFWKIIFRFSLPGVIAGATLLLVQAATSLIIVKYMGDGQISLIVDVIESYFFKGSNFSFGAAISVVLALFVFAIIFISNMLSRLFEHKGGNRKHEKLS